MAGGVKTFAPKQSQLVIGGQLIGGYAADTFIQLARNADMYALTVGVDSFGTRVKSDNYSGRLTVTLQQTSPSNNVLDALASADELTDSGAVPMYFQSGDFISTAVTMWVVKRPDSDFGSSVSNRVWVLETDYLIYEVKAA